MSDLSELVEEFGDLDLLENKDKELNSRKAYQDAYYRAVTRDRRLKKKYGLSIKQVKKILALQGNCCGICKTKETGKVGWCVDHSHASGRVRGILCSKCNTMLGQAQDNPDYLEAGVRWIRFAGINWEQGVK